MSIGAALFLFASRRAGRGPPSPWLYARSAQLTTKGSFLDNRGRITADGFRTGSNNAYTFFSKTWPGTAVLRASIIVLHNVLQRKSSECERLLERIIQIDSFYSPKPVLERLSSRSSAGCILKKACRSSSSCTRRILDTICNIRPTVHFILIAAQPLWGFRALHHAKSRVRACQYAELCPSSLASARTYMIWLKPQLTYGYPDLRSPHSILRCQKLKDIPAGVLNRSRSKHS